MTPLLTRLAEATEGGRELDAEIVRAIYSQSRSTIARLTAARQAISGRRTAPRGRLAYVSPAKIGSGSKRRGKDATAKLS